MPFSRLDESRKPHEGRAGLELALVDLAMCKHDGSATVLRSALGGARIEPIWEYRNRIEPASATPYRKKQARTY